jgi:hypothetical protein
MTDPTKDAPIPASSTEGRQITIPSWVFQIMNVATMPAKGIKAVAGNSPHAIAAATIIGVGYVVYMRIQGQPASASDISDIVTALTANHGFLMLISLAAAAWSGFWSHFKGLRTNILSLYDEVQGLRSDLAAARQIVADLEVKLTQQAAGAAGSVDTMSPQSSPTTQG